MYPKLENVIKQDDKSTIKIEVSVIVDRENFEYKVSVWKRGFRKKKFENICNDWNDDYKYRELSMAARRLFDAEKMLEYVSKMDILRTKMSLWNHLKPC